MTFTFLGTGAFSGTAGELRYEQAQPGLTLVEADVNGDMVADMTIRLFGNLTLQATDFDL